MLLQQVLQQVPALLLFPELQALAAAAVSAVIFTSSFRGNKQTFSRRIQTGICDLCGIGIYPGCIEAAVYRLQATISLEEKIFPARIKYRISIIIISGRELM